VTAIEPNSKYARFMRAAIKAVDVIEAAASDRSGEAVLRIPTSRDKLGMATVESQNDLDLMATTALHVKLLTLDSLKLRDVGLIKIDVEGHKLAVPRGSQDTISAIVLRYSSRLRKGTVQVLSNLFARFLPLTDIAIFSCRVIALLVLRSLTLTNTRKHLHLANTVSPEAELTLTISFF
jgi:FkbM family methyltransferase